MHPKPPKLSDRRELITFVCEQGWAAVRGLIPQYLSKGGMESLEAAAVLVGESEARNQIPDDDHLPERVWGQLRHASHPLGWLRARRSPLEREVEAWQYRSDGSGSRGAPAPVSGSALPDGPPVNITPRPVTDPRALNAFTSIMTSSNGRAEAFEGVAEGRCQATQQFADSLVGRFKPLEPVDRHRRPTARLVPARGVVTDLLAIAVNGGAYDMGRGVRGRLDAWDTLRFLVGADPHLNFDEVNQLVELASWIRFDTEGLHWFDNIHVWDGCYACATPTESRVTAIAWTDTD